MKKYLLLLFLVSISYSQTRTSIFKLPQWGTGDTLKAGTASDSAQSNFGLNNGFYRLEAIMSRQIDSSGLNRFVYGRGTGNLTIDAGVGTATPQRIVLNDSLYGTYNWQTTGNLLVGGNTVVGGYLTVDSVVQNGTFTVNSIQTLGSGGIVSYGGGSIQSASGNVLAGNNLFAGTAGTNTGSVQFELLSSSGEPSGMRLKPVDGDYNDTLYLPHKSGANRQDTIVTMNGEQNLYSYLGHYGQSGIATVGGGDSVQVTFSGFTSGGIVMVTYEGANAARTKIPVVGYKRTNGFTIYADASYNVAWFVVKK